MARIIKAGPDAPVIHKTFTFEVIRKAEAGETPGGRIRVNTARLDRENDIIPPSGAVLDNYLLNPVVQWMHNYADPWSTIGRSIVIEHSKEYIDIDFELRPAANEYDPQTIILLQWNGLWVKCASIGMRPLTYKANSSGGFIFPSWEFVEWSLVPIPMNPDALRQLGVQPSAEVVRRFYGGFESMAKAPMHPSIPVLDGGGLLQKSISLDRLVEEVSTAIYRVLWDRDSDGYYHYDGVRRHVAAVYEDHAIACIGLAFYRVDFTIDAGLVKVQPRDEWVEVDREWPEISSTMTTIERSMLQVIGKAGARHSTKDMNLVQQMHDTACALGAACGSDETKAEADEDVTIKTQQAPEEVIDIDKTNIREVIASFKTMFKR
ncbi:hypothetical protein ACP8Y2_06965 [Herpetosiphon llansteffanensis]